MGSRGWPEDSELGTGALVLGEQVQPEVGKGLEDRGAPGAGNSATGE